MSKELTREELLEMDMLYEDKQRVLAHDAAQRATIQQLELLLDAIYEAADGLPTTGARCTERSREYLNLPQQITRMHATIQQLEARVKELERDLEHYADALHAKLDSAHDQA